MKKISIFLLCVFLSIFLISCGNNRVAKEVLKYEKELNKEVDKLNKESPEYIRNYTKVYSVFCSYELKSGSDTAEIVKKYNMEKKFACGNVYDYDSADYICMIFDRDNFTASIARKVKNIKFLESKIIKLTIQFETEVGNQMFPNINYYDKDAKSIPYEEVKKEKIGSWPFVEQGLKSGIIKSKEEYDDYLNDLLELECEDFYVNYLKENIDKQRSLYDKTFFEENVLIVTQLLVRGSGSIQLKVKHLLVNDTKAYVLIESTSPSIGTADMQYTFFVLKVKKSDVVNVTEIITLE